MAVCALLGSGLGLRRAALARPCGTSQRRGKQRLRHVAASAESPAGGDEEPTLAAILAAVGTLRTTVDTLTTTVGTLAKDMATKGELKQMEERQKTLLGAVYDAAVAAVPDRRVRRVYSEPMSLAADCGLPHDAAAEQRLLDAVLRKHEAAHELRRRVMSVLRKQGNRLRAAVSLWSSLPPPNTEAEWLQQAQVLGPLAGALAPGSEAHQGVLLLLKYSKAAVEALREGRPDALVRVVTSMPRPGEQQCSVLMALALALAGKRSRELEFDAVWRLTQYPDGSLCIQETSLQAAGVRKATRHLRLAFRLVAWLHSELGAPLPRLEGRIVVPRTEVREAQRKLRGARKGVKDSVPGGGGATFVLTIDADTV